MFADIVDMFVDLVCNHDDFRMFFQDFGQACQFFCTIDRACRVRRGAEDQRLCLRCDSRFQLCRSDFEILFDTGRNDYWCTFGQFYHFRIADPERSRDNHFVTRIYQYHDCITNGLFGTICARNLVGCVFQSVFVFQLGNDGVTQGRITSDGRITRIVFVDSFFGSILNRFGSIEVGLSDT